MVYSHRASVLTLALMLGRNTLISIAPLTSSVKNQMGSGLIQNNNTHAYTDAFA